MTDLAESIKAKKAKRTEYRTNMERLAEQIIDRLPTELADQFQNIAQQIGEQQDTITNRLGKDGVARLVSQIEVESNVFKTSAKELFATPALWDHHDSPGSGSSSATLDTTMSKMPRHLVWRLGNAINQAIRPFATVLSQAGYEVGLPYGDRDYFEILSKLSCSPETAKLHEGYRNLGQERFKLSNEIAELEREVSKAKAKDLWHTAGKKT